MLYGHKILVFCTSKIYKSRFCDFISSLNEELVKQNWRIMIFATESDLSTENKNDAGEKHIFELINFDIADTLLIDNSNLRDEALKTSLIEKAHKKNIPVVLLNGNRPECYNIAYNQEKGFEQICRHVIERHRITDLHFIAGTKNSPESNVRIQTFQSVLQENNITFNDSMVSYGDFWDLPAKKAVYKLIEENRLPKAIICANDKMAIAVAEAIKEKNLYCPEDVIVTGFDGINSIFFSNPKITSVLCNHKNMGKETANLILSIQDSQTPYSTFLQPTLFVSESCGCVSRQPSNALKFFDSINDSYTRYRNENVSLNNMSVVIHDCKNIEEVIDYLVNPLFYNLMFLVKAECIDSSVDPDKCHSSTVYGSTMYLLADSDTEKEPETRFIKTTDLIPRMEEVLTLYKYPLIFAPVNNTTLPIGYLCCFYRNYDSQNYTKVSQIASWLGNAISGYRNAQYLRYLQQKLEDIYKYDTLTGLFNRNGFVHRYNKIMKDNSVTTLTMAMCDLDNLKYINDNFSHNEGDNAINIVGQALSNAIENGEYCRYGGDEIIGIYTRAVDAETIKQRIKIYLDNYNANSGKPYEVSTSVGVFTSPKIPFEEMFAKADKLMYAEKQTKKKYRR